MTGLIMGIATAALFVSVMFLGIGVSGDLTPKARAWRQRYLSRTGEELDAAFLEYSPAALLSLSLGGAFLVVPVLLLLSGSIFLSATAGAAVLSAPRIWLSRVKKKRTQAFDGQLPDALASLTNSLRAGLSLPQAFESVSREYPPPLSQEIGLVLREVSLGRDLEEAVESMAKRVGSTETRVLAAALSAVKGIGGSLSDVLERIAVTLRERQGMEEKVRALTAQGRFQAVVIGLMPPALGLILYALDPSMIIKLFRDPLGWGVLAVVFLLEGTGILILRRVVAVDI